MIERIEHGCTHKLREPGARATQGNSGNMVELHTKLQRILVIARMFDAKNN